MNRLTTSFVLTFLCSLAASGVTAQLSLPDVFGNRMVLQREVAIPVWGTAEQEAKVTLALNSTVTTATADSEGNWSVSLPAMSAGGPYFLDIVSGPDSVQIKDVYVGEVWLCSGQSNMEWSLRISAEGELEVPQADNPMIRLFHLKKRHDTYKTPYSAQELTDFTAGDFFERASWETCRPETAADFSAVAYFFGKELYDSLRVPIGLIQAAVGGSPAQSWIKEEALAGHPQLAHLVAGDSSWLRSRIIHPWLAERAQQNWAEWDDDDGDSLPGHPFAPFYLYEAAIEPLVPYAFRGAIWYQGESNATHPQSYAVMQNTLIRDWRKRFGRGDFPFYFVQLPKIGNRSRWPEFREAQQQSLSLPNTGMIVTLDQGHPTDVHPREKRVIGQRLAGLALAETYGRNLPALSPLAYKHSWAPAEKTITVWVDHAYDGLALSEGQRPLGFTLQGYTEAGSKEMIIAPAEVTISGNRIVLKYPDNFAPVAVKYAWAPFPENNLVNSSGLPLAPFNIELVGNN